MIKSRYFPDSARCLAEVPLGNDKIEIPADVYDKVADELGAKKNFILRGAYPYEAVKIIAQSKLVKALEFDDVSGEIKTSSTVGITAEMELAFAIWNFYDEESAIDRVIFSRLKASGKLQEISSDGVEKNQDGDDYTSELEEVAEEFGKKAAGKSVGYFRGKFQSDKTIDIDSPVQISIVPQIFHKVKDLTGDMISSFWNEIVLVANSAEDIKDCYDGRISKKQLAKNMTVTAAGMAGYPIGYAMGGAVAAIAGAPAVIAFIPAFLVGYGFKKAYKAVAKEKLDAFFKDDSEKMKKIFDEVQAEILAGKFLTIYEMAIFEEAKHDDIKDECLKDMYSAGKDDSARAEWARQHIAGRLNDIFNQRSVILMPSAQDWADGLQRVQEKISRGVDISAEMESKREKALSEMRAFLERIKLKPYKLGDAMKFINAIKETQYQISNTLHEMQADNQHHAKIRQQQNETDAALDSELQKLLDWR